MEMSYARQKYREFKAVHWGAVHGAANRDRDMPYEFPDFDTFVKHSLTGDELQKAILDRRITKCLSTGSHYPFERQPLFVDLKTLLAIPRPPHPANCARCGIGGPYRISLDNAGRPVAAETL
jgi:hypothetical protein